MTLKLSTEEEKIHADENDDHQCQQQPKGDCVFIGPAWRESDIVCLPSTQNDCPMPTLHQVSDVMTVDLTAPRIEQLFLT